MAPLPDLAARKRAAARAAIDAVEPGMIVGLGTGSTAAFAIEALGERIAGGLAVQAVATSERTAAAARAAGIPLLDPAALSAIDLCIDGVDDIDPAFRAIKGAGGAMLREKIVATLAHRMIAIADDSKQVARIGRTPVPVEVLSLALGLVQARIATLGATPVLRMEAAGRPWRSDQGNLVIDCRFPALEDPERTAAALSAIPGLLGHGLFLTQIDALYVGTGFGGGIHVVRADRPPTF